MSRYDGLIIPRSYSEYINKTDAATLQQALQLNNVLAQEVAAGNNKAVKSSAVNNALNEYINKTDAATLQQALQLPGVLSEAVAAGDNKAVTSNAVNGALANLDKIKVNILQGGGVDFNTVFVDANGEKATYFIYGSSANPNSNAPMGLNTTNFIVESVFSDGRVTQTAYHNEMQNLVYIRTKGGSAWTKWEQLATKSELGSYNIDWTWKPSWSITREQIENSAKGAENYKTFSGETRGGIEGCWNGYKHNGYGEGIIYTRYYIIGFSFSADTFKYKIIMELNL